ncbi:hypothetical protein [Butyrivibrio proteoclasticus]|uniref:hypothetical protein n=1 Tax=Butyrivibrio proteoclasticus TaxID=43305 RepID=UPI00047CCD6D|nr:hypothetical protein [Butyrivibrio proteoclasticus]
MIYQKKYTYDANADVGGGAPSGSTADQGDVSINEEVYTEIVDRISDNNELIVDDNQAYVEPDAKCLINEVVPDYQEADHIALDMFHAMKDETKTLVKLMRNIKENYVSVDTEKEKEIAKGNETYSAV